MEWHNEYDLEGGLHIRYNHVMDLLETTYLVPSYYECVALQGSPVLKQRFESAARAWMLPPNARHEVIAFLVSWDGILETLVTFLERIAKQLHAHHREHTELLNILIYR